MILDRRGVLLGGVGAAAAGSRGRPRDRPRVVLVGAGLAGLTAAHRLHRRTGWRVELHEARDRVGGRLLTVRDLPDGSRCEAGASFISTGDHAIRDLARELRVPLHDLEEDWPAGGTTYRFGGRERLRDRVFRGRPAVWREAERQWRQTGHDRLDRLTIAEWLDRHVANPVLADFLRVYFESDYTAPVDEASALMAVADLGTPGRSYDERYVVADGSDALTSALAGRLPAGTVHLGSELLAVRRRDRGYRLAFGGGTVDADAVVLALPFSTLRRVDLSSSGFSPRKRRAIRTLGMGVAMKVNLALDPPGSGESVSDLTPGWTWPDRGLTVCLTGATAMPDVADAPVHGLAPDALADTYLDDLETLMPGARAAYRGFTRVDRWVADPWTRGTYSYYRVGTMTGIAGVEGRPEGAAFFAGEHTAHFHNRATMNGAVWSGERAARDVQRFLTKR